MRPYKKEKVEEILQHAAAEFFRKESGPQSLLTVVGVNFDEKKKRAVILFSILPVEKTKSAIDFIERQKRDFIDYLKKNTKMKIIPFISFELSPIIA